MLKMWTADHTSGSDITRVFVTVKQDPQVIHRHVKVCKALYWSVGLEEFSR